MASANLLAQIEHSRKLAEIERAKPSVQESLNDFEKFKVEKIKTTFESDKDSQRFAASVLTLICDEKTQHPSLIARSLYKTLDARAGTPQYRALLLHVTRVIPGFKNPKKLNNVIQFFTTMQEDSQASIINGASDGKIIATARSLLRELLVKNEKLAVKNIQSRGQIEINLPQSPKYSIPTGKFVPPKGGTRKRKTLRKRTRKARKYSKK